MAGCERESRNRGFCRMHYQRFRRHGDPLKAQQYEYRERAAGGRECAVEGCERDVHARGWCFKHYQRVLKNGDPLESRRYELIADDQRCAIEGCGKPVVARGWCRNHYTMWQRTGDPVFRSDWHRRRDEPILDRKGYVLVYAPKHANARKSSRVPEHRLVMSERLGRPLRDDETVHHINGDKADNRLENLELWCGAHPSGQRVSDLVAFARTILEQYGGLDHA